MDKRSVRLTWIIAVGFGLITVAGVFVSIYQVSGWFIALGVSVGLLLGALIGELINPNGVSTKPAKKTAAELVQGAQEEVDATERAVIAAKNQVSAHQDKAGEALAIERASWAKDSLNEANEWAVILKQNERKHAAAQAKLAAAREQLRQEVDKKLKRVKK